MRYFINANFAIEFADTLFRTTFLRVFNYLPYSAKNSQQKFSDFVLKQLNILLFQFCDLRAGIMRLCIVILTNLQDKPLRIWSNRDQIKNTKYI